MESSGLFERYRWSYSCDPCEPPKKAYARLMSEVFSGLRSCLVAFAAGSTGLASSGEAVGQIVLSSKNAVTAQKTWSEAFIQGDALLQEGEIHGDVKLLAQAADIFRQEALPLARYETRSNEWAQTQAKLGRAQLCIGALTGDLTQFEEAATTFRLALKASSRESAPTRWAVVQNNLGGALLGIGKKTGQVPTLKDAEAAFRLAMEVHTVQAAPKQWAEAQTNLGITHFLLGDLTGDTTYFSSARDELLSAQPLLAKPAAQSVATILKQVERRIPAS